MRHIIYATLIGLLPATAPAQDVGECDWRGSAQAIAEPWEAATRTYANGDIRLAIMDVMEPAAGPVHLLILSPPRDETGYRQCRIMSLEGTIGFANLTLEGSEASYDPASGLTVILPASRWRAATADYTDAALTVTINQITGEITGVLD